MIKKIIFSAFFLLTFYHSAHAQYWTRWVKTHNVTLGLSSDEKWAFFIKKNEAGVDNIYKIELKTNAVTPVTNFNERPVLSGIVIFGKPAVVYARANSAKGDDIHLYRINVLTTDPPVDFTPGDGSSSKKIIGMAYNGRYVYYTADKGANTKTDTYRYDTQQYITELALANDKDYKTLCWSRDQTHLLLRDPKTLDVYSYSIETTDKQKLQLPYSGDDLKSVFYDPMNTSYYLINEHEQLSLCKVGAVSASDAQPVPNATDVSYAELSLNGKYIHSIVHDAEKIMDNATHTYLDLSALAFDMIVGPKETMVYYAYSEGTDIKLFLYDIAKKTAKEIASFK
jgi:hypothetical protein